jgi:hypothetical protein
MFKIFLHKMISRLCLGCCRWTRLHLVLKRWLTAIWNYSLTFASMYVFVDYPVRKEATAAKEKKVFMLWVMIVRYGECWYSCYIIWSFTKKETGYSCLSAVPVRYQLTVLIYTKHKSLTVTWLYFAWYYFVNSESI